MNNYSEIEKAELIDRYMRRKLNAKEELNFQEMLQKDSTFRQEVENMEVSREIITSYGLKEEISQIRQSMLAEKKQPIPLLTPTKSKSVTYYAMRIAAGLLILLVAFIGIQLTTLSGESLYEKKAEPYIASTFRGESNAEDIKNRYLAGDYAGYLEGYEQVAAPTVENIFLAGNAYLETGKTGQAIQSFEQVLELNRSGQVQRYEEDAEYYLGLALVREGNYEEGLKIFNKIKENPSHQYHDEISGYYLWQIKMLEWAK